MSKLPEYLRGRDRKHMTDIRKLLAAAPVDAAYLGERVLRDGWGVCGRGVEG